MRYCSQGDWFTDANGDLRVFAMQTPDKRHSMLVAVHELLEALSCEFHGITAQEVDKFDFASTADDPGMESDAPYRKEHLAATGHEMILAQQWGVDWKQYEQSLIDNEKH